MYIHKKRDYNKTRNCNYQKGDISVYKEKENSYYRKRKKIQKESFEKVQEFEKRLSDSLTSIFVTLEIQKLLWLWITKR